MWSIENFMAGLRPQLEEAKRKISQARAGRAASAETAKPNSPTSVMNDATVRTK